jgi:hypothetical protein
MATCPHEGRELALMLEGRKYLAAFCDILPLSGKIPEEIIPDQAFAPFVASGRIKRFARTIPSPQPAERCRIHALPSPAMNGGPKPISGSAA